MAFCKNCGRELQDGETCNCSETFNKVQETEQVTQKKDNKKILVTGGVGVAALAAVIIIFSSMGGGYKQPVNDLIASFNKCDSEKMMSSILPKKKLKEMKKEMKDESFDWDDLMDKMDEGLEDMIEDLEDDYGKNIKFSVEFLDKKKVKGDDFDEIADEYEDDFDAKISKAYKVKVKMQVKGKKDKETETSWLYVVKVKGDDWKISTYKDESGLTDMLTYSFF
ncbi:MAG: hypothetical protein K2J40_08635 [Ruminococcus sp.]|nr:hypothetical protein [Ruminococcus sp.]